MKKIIGICGGISSIIGFVLYISAQIVISSNTRYTWRPPYTEFEAQHIAIKTIGIILLIAGLIDLSMLLISKFYVSKTQKDPTSNEVTTIRCPVCGLSVQKTTTTCPNCKTKIHGGE